VTIDFYGGTLIKVLVLASTLPESIMYKIVIIIIQWSWIRTFSLKSKPEGYDEVKYPVKKAVPQFCVTFIAFFKESSKGGFFLEKLLKQENLKVFRKVLFFFFHHFFCKKHQLKIHKKPWGLNSKVFVVFEWFLYMFETYIFKKILYKSILNM